jgi:hypothetical protein
MGTRTACCCPTSRPSNHEVLHDAAAAEIACLDGFYDQVGFTARFAQEELSASDAELMVTAALGNPFSAKNRRPVGEPALRAVLAAAGAPVHH